MGKKTHRIGEDEWHHIRDDIKDSIHQEMKDWRETEQREKKDEEWEDIARKIEEKVRKSIKDWLDKPC